MGFIAKIIDVTKRGLKIDSGGGNLIQSARFMPTGEDSKPLKTDYVVAEPTIIAGSAASIGYVDLKNEPKTDLGEKRIYSRDKETGEVVAEFWLKNDGSIRGSNSNGFFELLPSGEFVANGVTMSTGGAIVADSISIGGLDFAAHVHGGVTTGTATTGVPE